MWLKRLFNLRDKTSRSRGALAHDAEKPFLEHLEDLRTMIVRVVVTLLISTIACFVFSKQLVEIIRQPAKSAGIYQNISLPDEVTKEDWAGIRHLNESGLGLTPLQRKLFFDFAFKDEKSWEGDRVILRKIAEIHYAYLASEQLAEEDRDAFLIQAVSSPDDPQLLAAARLLLEAKTPADLDGNVSAITMQALGPTEMFKMSIKLSLYAGIVVSFPLLFYFIAQFVFPGLTVREKKLLWPSLSIGFGLFLVGVIFAYYFVTVEALKFFHNYTKDFGVEDQWKIGEYVSFTTQLILIFGISFELPVVVMALVKLGLLSHSFMRQTRSYAIIIILVVAAIITPTPDAIVLSALSGPMIILYEICIWLSYFMESKERKREEEEERNRPSVTPAAKALPHGDDEHTPGSGNAHDHSEGGQPGGDENWPAHPHDDPYHDDHHGSDHSHDPYHDDHHSSDHSHDPYSGHDGYYDDYYRDQSSDSEDGQNAEDSQDSTEQDSGADAIETGGEPDGPSDDKSSESDSESARDEVKSDAEETEETSRDEDSPSKEQGNRDEDKTDG